MARADKVLAVGESEETKDRILEAAVKVFSESGYHNATMTRIAERAGVAKGTVYWYFASKEELFIGIIETGLSRVYARLKLVLSDGELKPDAKLRRVIEEYLLFFKEQHYLSKVVSTGIQGLSQGFHARFMEWRKRFIKINAELIAEGVAAGLFRQELDPEKVALALSGILAGIGSQHLLTGEELNEEKETLFVFTLLLHGISS
ncbi:MAG: TetR/AcrR family transcriptional regulator [Firmicutes bacterium]|nr:TetR/AcrR family transcriptional regulator [Bacillota bacterium]